VIGWTRFAALGSNALAASPQKALTLARRFETAQ